MKKMILGLAFSAGALFGAEASSSGFNNEGPTHHQLFLPLQFQPNAYIHPNTSTNNQPNAEAEQEQSNEQQAPGDTYEIPEFCNYNRGTVNNFFTYQEINPRSLKGLMMSGVNSFIQASGQTAGTLLTQEIYHATKNYLFPNEEAAFQESIAKLKLQQAQNNEKEREISIEMAQVNVKMVDEMRELVTVVRTLGAEATKRPLSNEESEQLSSAKYSLSILQGILKAASAA